MLLLSNTLLNGVDEAVDPAALDWPFVDVDWRLFAFRVDVCASLDIVFGPEDDMERPLNALFMLLDIGAGALDTLDEF